MGDQLHSLAYTSSLHSSSSLGWDFHNLGVLNADTMSFVMDGNAPFYSSPPLEESDYSTGYLEDALVEFSERSKRRRLVLYTDDDQTDDVSKDLAKSYWNSNCTWGMSENLYSLSQMNNMNGLSDGLLSTSMSGISEEAMKTPEEGPEATDSSSSSYKDLISAKSNHIENLFSTSPMAPGGGGEKKKKRVITRVVYPFALVKPGGVEGDVTLNDINERILMPPTRPVRHPVGDFACRPCVSPHGPGLSGKAVVALTKIHTQGRGTITIIRTKG
ncbi:protein XRI1-like [Fagus crenata]|uniref:Protein XRI1 n=1 Tax=Fagus sylvatica TaxID=28930 RepID=A0A2N9ESI8_FAGSY